MSDQDRTVILQGSSLPVGTQLNFHINLSTGASAAAVAVDVAKVYLETDN